MTLSAAYRISRSYIDAHRTASVVPDGQSLIVNEVDRGGSGPVRRLGKESALGCDLGR